MTLNEPIIQAALMADSGACGSGRLRTALGALTLVNPVMPASGCFGPELIPLIPVAALGAVVTKTIFAGVRAGNPAPRIAESSGGLLNSIGIPSPGIDYFRATILPAYQASGVPVIVSIGGLSAEDYLKVTEALADDELAALEINVSCPNLEAGGLEIGSDPRLVERVTAGVRERAGGRPVITKLTPNVRSVADLARAAEAGGADAVTVANTFLGIAVSAASRAPVLGNFTGGLSGPPVKPLVLNLVEQVARAVGVRVVASGGIRTALDVAEYMIAGATAVQVGTATFARPGTMPEIIAGLPPLLDRLAVRDVSQLIGTLAGVRAGGDGAPAALRGNHG